MRYDGTRYFTYKRTELHWLWTLVILCCCVPICYRKCKTKKEGEENTEEHPVDTADYTKVDEGDFHRAPEGEVPILYNLHSNGEIKTDPLMNQYGQPMQPI